MKNYKKYHDIPEKYRFDLESLLEGRTLDQLIDELLEYRKKDIAIKDEKYNSPEQFLESLKLGEKMALLENKISNYLSNNINVNLVDPNWNRIASELEYKLDQLSKEKGSELNRLFAHSEKIEKWIQREDFAIYRKNLESILESKKHKLSDEVENYLNETRRGEPSPANTFVILSDSEVDFGYAHDSKGKKYKITDASRMMLLKSKDEQVRRETFEKYFKGYYKHRQSFASLLNDHFKRISVSSLSRKFNSSIEALISEDKADEKLLEIIYSNISQKHGLFKKYHDAHKKFFFKKFNKKMKRWDGNVELIKNKQKFEVEEGQKIVLEALKPMGEEYLKVVKEAFDNRWIDYMNVPAKTSGAYSIGSTYGIEKKYILMNWDYSIDSVSTLAHEIGHSMHSHFSNLHQPYELADYPIFLAEIASIFNELMLSDYLVKNSKSDELKFYLLGEAISVFEGTVRRQALFSNYEFELYKATDKGVPLSTYEEFEKIYQKVSNKFYGKKDDFKTKYPLTNITSVIIPHYYYDFYVYKYAIGYIVANVFFKKYQQEGIPALENYIKQFLSKGGSKWPIELLKDAGIDLYDQKIYDEAFEVLEDKIEEYIKLGKKIFK